MKLIEKELEKSKVPQHEIKEVKLLLDSLHQEDLSILRKLSKNSEVNILERNNGNRLQLEKMDNTWNGSVYSIKDIKTLCINYRLRFLSSNYYKGKFDAETVQLIKKFSTENDVTLTDYFLQTKFFIMAPPNMFSLSEAKYVTKKQLDPVLFYKIDDEHYKKIHAWGTDFSVLRRVIGWKWEDCFNEFIFNFCISFCLITILFSYLFPVTMYNHYILSSMVNLIGSVFISKLCNHTDDWEQIDEFFTPHNWNTAKKLI